MGMIRRSNPPAGSSMAAIPAIFAVLGLALTVELALLANQDGGMKSAYDSAPVCASAADISSCRFQGPARIVRTSTDKQGNPSVDVTFAQLGGRQASAHLDQAYTPEWQTWQVESQVNAELWSGRLVLVADVKTLSNPDTFPVSALVTWTWIAGAGTLAMGALFAWLFVRYRRAASERKAKLAIEAAEHPLATQRLPLTPEMTTFLQSEAALAKHPIQVVLFILLLASIIPAVFSVVFILRAICSTQERRSSGRPSSGWVGLWPGGSFTP